MQVMLGMLTMTTGGEGVGDGDGCADVELAGPPPVPGVVWRPPTVWAIRFPIGSWATATVPITRTASNPSSTGISGNLRGTGRATGSCSIVTSVVTGGSPAALSCTLNACGCGGPS